MATRNLLHISKLEAFKDWLGERALKPKGHYEEARWKTEAGLIGIVFRKSRGKEHFSINDIGYNDVRKFIWFSRSKKYV